MTKEPKNTKASNSDREFAVILEKVYSEIKIIGENQRAFADKLDATMGMVAKNREDITMLGIRIPGIKDELIKLNGKIAKIESDIAIIKDDFGKRLSRLEAFK